MNNTAEPVVLFQLGHASASPGAQLRCPHQLGLPQQLGSKGQGSGPWSGLSLSRKSQGSGGARLGNLAWVSEYSPEPGLICQCGGICPALAGLSMRREPRLPSAPLVGPGAETLTPGFCSGALATALGSLVCTTPTCKKGNKNCAFFTGILSLNKPIKGSSGLACTLI